MNISDMFKLMPLMDDIKKAVVTIERYMADPEVVAAVGLVQKLESDPDVKDALATATKVAKVLTAQGTSNEKVVIGNTGNAIA
jgi:hypothetical protein